MAYRDELRRWIEARRGEESQKRLAARAEVPNSSLNGFLKNRRGLSLDYIDKIVDALTSLPSEAAEATLPTRTAEAMAADPPADAAAAGPIRAKCAGEWPDDFAMRAYCEKQQQEALVKLRGRTMNAGDYRTIRNKCAGEWADDFQMRNYCEEQQLKALAAIKR